MKPVYLCENQARKKPPATKLSGFNVSYWAYRLSTETNFFIILAHSTIAFNQYGQTPDLILLTSITPTRSGSPRTLILRPIFRITTPSPGWISLNTSGDTG